MRGKGLLVLSALVVAIGAFIFLFERHTATTEERKESAEKLFPGLEQDAVTMIEIHGASGELKLAKLDDQWRLTSPIDFPAEPSAISSLLGAMVDLRSERTLGAAEVDPAAYALDKPAYTVVLHTKDGGSHRLTVGDETALGGNRAVSRKPGEVLLCAGWFVTDLDRKLDDWRSHDVVDISEDQVASIEVVTPQDRVHVVRDGALWKLLEPLADIADREFLRNLVSDLNSMRVEEFLGPETDVASLSLEEPRYRITIVRSGATAPIVLELGAITSQGEQKRVACRRNSNELLLVDDRAETALGKAPVRWRSPVVFPFDSWDVEGVTFSRGGTEVSCVRAEGMWKLASGGEVDSGSIYDRLAKLAQLKANAFDLLEPGTPEIGSVRLQLGPAADAAKRKEVTLTFLAPIMAGGDAVVRVSERATVMSVPATDVEAVLETLDTLSQLQATPTAEPATPGQAKDDS